MEYEVLFLPCEIDPQKPMTNNAVSTHPLSKLDRAPKRMLKADCSL
jgi:hypothetical protein